MKSVQQTFTIFHLTSAHAPIRAHLIIKSNAQIQRGDRESGHTHGKSRVV